MFQKIIKGI